MKIDEPANMVISSLVNDNIARILMSGVFDFNARKLFKEVSEPILNNDRVGIIVIELGQVSDIGTGGMGILYLMQERCTAHKKTLKIIHPVGKVKEWLLIANDNKLFDLEAI